MLRLIAVIFVGFFMYALAFVFGLLSLIYGWGLSPVNWFWIIGMSIASIFTTAISQLIIEAIKE